MPGLKGYRKLARMAAAVVSEPGFLCLGCCSHHVTAEQFAAEAWNGIREAGRGGRLLRSAGAGPDHPDPSGAARDGLSQVPRLRARLSSIFNHKLLQLLIDTKLKSDSVPLVRGRSSGPECRMAAATIVGSHALPPEPPGTGWRAARLHAPVPPARAAGHRGRAARRGHRCPRPASTSPAWTSSAARCGFGLDAPRMSPRSAGPPADRRS